MENRTIYRKNIRLLLGLTINGHDKSDRDYVKKLEDQLAEMKRIEQDLKRLSVIIRDSNDAITLLDLDGNILAWNRGAEKIYGYSEDEALGTNIFEHMVPAEKQEEMRNVVEQLKNGKSIDSFETKRLTKEGQVLDIWITVTPLFDDSGQLVQLATTERDVTEKNRLIRELAELSLKDELTGIYNRRGFSTFAEKLLQLIRRHNGRALLIYMDMDNLKWINDTLGHAKGDEAITRFADILRQTFRETDVVARMGGDEFAVLTEVNGRSESVTSAVGRLYDNIKKANAGQNDYSLSVSIGTVEESCKEVTLEKMLQQADTKMYQEKKQKRIKRGE